MSACECVYSKITFARNTNGFGETLKTVENVLLLWPLARHCVDQGEDIHGGPMEVSVHVGCFSKQRER